MRKAEVLIAGSVAERGVQAVGRQCYAQGFVSLPTYFAMKPRKRMADAMPHVTLITVVAGSKEGRISLTYFAL